MTGQMTEQIAADIAGDGDKCAAGNQAADTPQQIVAGDQRPQQQERAPNMRGRTGRQSVDEELDAVLLADRTTDGRQYGQENRRMPERTLDHVAPKESERTRGVSGDRIHRSKSWAVAVG